jgi:hypothetical protein
MDILIPLLGPNLTFTDEVIRSSIRRGDPVFEALEVVCKAPEVTLPGGMSFEDKEGKVRHEVRIAWWKEDCSTYKMAAQGPPSVNGSIPDSPLGLEWPLSRAAGRIRALLVHRDASCFIAQRCLRGLQRRSRGSSARCISMEWRSGIAVRELRLGEINMTDQVRCSWVVMHGRRR